MTEAEKHFARSGTIVTYRKRQVLVRKDETSQWMFFIKSGLVKVSFSLADGTERLMGFYVPGMVFAQLSALLEDTPDGMEYEATQETEVLRLSLQDFMNALEEDATMNHEFLCATMRIQLFLIERLEYQGEKGIRQKYLKWLLFMAKYYGSGRLKDCVVSVPLTQGIIANFLHITRESASKATNELLRQGIIQISHRQLTIKDVSAIRALVA